MSSLPEESIEERLSHLEKEVLRLKASSPVSGSRKDWLTKLAGTAEGDADYAEIVRLGKEARDSETCED